MSATTDHKQIKTIVQEVQQWLSSRQPGSQKPDTNSINYFYHQRFRTHSTAEMLLEKVANQVQTKHYCCFYYLSIFHTRTASSGELDRYSSLIEFVGIILCLILLFVRCCLFLFLFRFVCTASVPNGRQLTGKDTKSMHFLKFEHFCCCLWLLLSNQLAMVNCSNICKQFQRLHDKSQLTQAHSFRLDTFSNRNLGKDGGAKSVCYILYSRPCFSSNVLSGGINATQRNQSIKFWSF